MIYILQKTRRNCAIELREVAGRGFHYSDQLLLIRVIRGSIGVHVWSCENILNENEFIIVNAKSIARYWPVSLTNLVAFIFIEPQYIQAFMGEEMNVIFKCNSVRNRIVDEKRYQDLSDQLELLCNDCFCHGVVSETLVKRVDAVLSHLLNHFEFISCGWRLKKFKSPIESKYRHLFDASLLDPSNDPVLSLKQISASLSLDYNFLKKDIVERYGHGFKEIQQGYLVEKAARLVLDDIDLSLTQISSLCGFSDPKYMIQYFKKYFKCTPSELRKGCKHHASATADKILMSIKV